jgi:hypothetical protein
MDIITLVNACNSLGIVDYNIEPNGLIWTGTNDNRTNLTDAQQKAVYAMAAETQAAKALQRQAVLDKLGLTADEVAALLG